MRKARFVAACLVLFALTQTAAADPEDRLKQYVNDMVVQVKQADDPAEKRQIMEASLHRLGRALDIVADKDIPDADRVSLTVLQTNIQDKLDELNGRNGFDRVPDSQLNAFADYVQQDIEQAERKVTLSLTTLLLILIIVILLVSL